MCSDAVWAVSHLEERSDTYAQSFVSKNHSATHELFFRTNGHIEKPDVYSLLCYSVETFFSDTCVLSFVLQLAEYRQKKALSDGQKKQKKKKKKVESEEQRRDDEDQTLGEQRGDQTTVFSLSKTLRSGETVTHDQTYTIEVRSQMSSEFFLKRVIPVRCE